MKKQLNLFLDSNLQNIIDEYKIIKLNEFEKFSEYFDLTTLDEDGTPKIECEHKVVIIFDNEEYNETYLLDVIAEYLKNHSWIAENIAFVYVDNFELRMKLFGKKLFDEMVESGLMVKKEFEKKYLPPCIMTINPIENEINNFLEVITPFTLKMIESIFLQTKIEE